MDIDIKIIYEGKQTLKRFRYILAKTGISLDNQRMEDIDCIRSWNGWIKVDEKTTPIANACIVCFLSNMEYILEKREGVWVEIYLFTKNSF